MIRFADESDKMSVKIMKRMAKVALKRRPDDLPMTGIIIREKKGQYAVLIHFTQTKHHYTDETVFAKDQKAVKKHIAKMYPKLKWRK